jgi:hypothetical protein
MARLVRVDLDAQRSVEDLETERDRFRGVISAGVCPQCGDLIARENTIDGWVYSAPCGHRLGRAQLAMEDDFGWTEASDE